MMSSLLLAAALLTFALGLVHSVLGERLVLRHLAGVQGLPSIRGGDAFCKRMLRLSWHTPSMLAWAFALILGRYAYLTELGGEERFVIVAISISVALCAVLWFAGTRGRHPGWAAFLVIAVLCWVAAGPL